MINPTASFEILVSTMFRSDLSFLEAMFPHGDMDTHAILVINQTDNARQLVSNSDNIRVINTQERGLPQSRNMAIKNAIGEICLVADDDVKYVQGVGDVVVFAFAKAPTATVITFQMVNDNGVLYRNYPDIKFHTEKSIGTVNGVVIAFNRSKLLEKEILYDPHFGLGATFQTANEFVFMKNVLAARVETRFEPQVILSHPAISSGQEQGSDRVIYGRSALKYKYSGKLSYLWVLKYVRFLLAHKYISLGEVVSKIKVGYAGIKAYRRLIKEELYTNNA